MYADHLVQPWLECVLSQLPETRIFDAHTHVGEHDPSGFAARVEELLGSLEPVDARAYEENHEQLPQRNQYLPGWDLISAAATVARTPAAPLPQP
jgi:hypothetical protein